jgi:hypothetical protein
LDTPVPHYFEKEVNAKRCLAQDCGGESAATHEAREDARREKLRGLQAALPGVRSQEVPTAATKAGTRYPFGHVISVDQAEFPSRCGGKRIGRWGSHKVKRVRSRKMRWKVAGDWECPCRKSAPFVVRG